jgi:hypothetical protein
LLFHRIFSKIKGKTFFSLSKNLNGRCEENEVLNSWH